MSGSPPDEVREALAGLTRRLDALAAGLARLDALAAQPAAPVGETLGEAERRALGPTDALLAVGAGLGRETALALAADRVIHHALADRAAIFLPAADGTLEAVVGRGFEDALRVGAGEGIVGRAFRERETVVGGPAHEAGDPLLRAHGLGQALAVPVRGAGGAVLGVLFAGRRRPVPFDGEVLAAMTILADRVALVLQGGRLATSSLAAAAVDFASELDLSRATRAVAQAAAMRLGVPSVAVLLPGDTGLRLAAGVGLAPGGEAPDAETEPLASVLRTGRAWSGGDADAGLAALLGAPPRLVFPLAVGERIVGVVVAGGPDAVPAGALADLAGPAATAIRNARLYTETAAALAEIRLAERDRPDAPAPVRDLGSLLAILLARVGLVRERVSDPALAADLAVAEEAAWRAVEAVRAVLGFGPGQRGGPLRPLDLGALLGAVLAEARARWAARAAAPPTVELDLEPLPPVRGRADELAEAVGAVLENAFEAVPSGGHIRVRARWDGGRRVEVAIEDSGPGLEDSVRARALEPFFTTKGGGRLGLGLPVAQAVLTRHQGTLELGSAPGKGTTVRLSLPTATGARPSRPLDPARVLVIEDEAPVREALVELFRQHGHVALAAADGPEGLATIEREPVDVVFTDLTVAPQVSGFDVARTVKRLRPGTPVILITGWPGRLDRAAVEASGIDRVVEKPVGATEVLAALAAALALRRGAAP